MCDLLRRALSFERYGHLMRHSKWREEVQGGGDRSWSGYGKASHTPFHLLRLIAVDVRWHRPRCDSEFGNRNGNGHANWDLDALTKGACGIRGARWNMSWLLHLIWIELNNRFTPPPASFRSPASSLVLIYRKRLCVLQITTALSAQSSASTRYYYTGTRLNTDRAVTPYPPPSPNRLDWIFYVWI